MAKIIIDKVDAGWASFVLLMSSLFGAFWYLFVLYLVLQVFDFATGWTNARHRGEEDSSVGREGIMKKVGCWIAIAVSFMMSYIFTHIGKDLLGIDLSFTEMIGWFTLTCFAINEFRSILENLVKMGVNVPDFLIRGLAITSKLIQAKTETDTETEA